MSKRTKSVIKDGSSLTRHKNYSLCGFHSLFLIKIAKACKILTIDIVIFEIFGEKFLQTGFKSMSNIYICLETLARLRHRIDKTTLIRKLETLSAKEPTYRHKPEGF